MGRGFGPIMSGRWRCHAIFWTQRPDLTLHGMAEMQQFQGFRRIRGRECVDLASRLRHKVEA
jgi:hypothetical protein